MYVNLGARVHNTLRTLGFYSTGYEVYYMIFI
jgi:hypothetical protein